MLGRVQVILVVTGIEAPTLEATFSKPAVKEPQVSPVENSSVRHPVGTLPVGAYNVERMHEYPEPIDLDLPAFLRKRVKYEG